MSIARRLTMHSVHLFLRIGLVLKDRERGTGKYDFKGEMSGATISIKMTGESESVGTWHGRMANRKTEERERGHARVCPGNLVVSFSLLFVPRVDFICLTTRYFPPLVDLILSSSNPTRTATTYKQTPYYSSRLVCVSPAESAF